MPTVYPDPQNVSLNGVGVRDEAKGDPDVIPIGFEARVHALAAAASCYGGANAAPEDFVRAAKFFEAYLKGDSQ